MWQGYFARFPAPTSHQRACRGPRLRSLDRMTAWLSDSTVLQLTFSGKAAPNKKTRARFAERVWRRGARPIWYYSVFHESHRRKCRSHGSRGPAAVGRPHRGTDGCGVPRRGGVALRLRGTRGGDGHGQERPDCTQDRRHAQLDRNAGALPASGGGAARRSRHDRAGRHRDRALGQRRDRRDSRVAAEH